MAAVRLTDLFALTTAGGRVRLTELVASTQAQARVRLTDLSGSTDGIKAVRFTTLRGSVDAAAGAPSVSPGSAQNVPAGSRVRLSCTGTATAPATITAYAWRVVTKSTGAGVPVFDNATIAAPTFRAPLVRKPATYTLGVTAIDSTGRRSTEATVVISTQQTEFVKAQDGAWKPMAYSYTRATGAGWL